jgi:hypothetical protein
MRTPKKLTKAQKQRLLKKLREGDAAMEPHAFDQIAPLFELIADFVIAECKDTESSDPKVRQRAEENVFELGLFGMKLMEELHPIYLRTLWKIEHMVGSAK